MTCHNADYTADCDCIFFCQYCRLFVPSTSRGCQSFDALVRIMMPDTMRVIVVRSTDFELGWNIWLQNLAAFRGGKDLVTLVSKTDGY